jgi:hypothetical protein
VRAAAIAIACLMLVVVGAGIAIVSVSSGSSTDCNRVRFDWAAWRAEKASMDPPTLREKYADCLNERQTLVRWTRRQVRAVLGKPEEWPSLRLSHWSYDLGIERGFFAMNLEYLVVRFDRYGRVMSTKTEIPRGTD